MMKLRDKATIGIMALFVLFAVPAFLLFPQLSSRNFLILVASQLAIFLAATYLLLFFIFRRLTEVSTALRTVLINKDFSKRVSRMLVGEDEMSVIVEDVNSLISKVEAAQDDLEFQTKAYGRRLEKAQALLERKNIDFEELEKDIVNLKKIAHSDSTTSLPNRISFNETLNNALQAAKKLNKKLAIMLINIDNFKNINDELGHENGDNIFKEIIKRFSTAIRRQDTMARFGGAVIVVLINDVETREELNSEADKILEACTQPIKIDHKEVHIIASIGVSVFPEDGLSLHELLKNADTAMFKAKRLGGRVSQQFTKELHLEVEKISKLGSALRSGLSSNEFVLHYQPKFNVKEGLMVGVEALLRWESLALGLIKPARFIPLAEETDFVIELGEWVLREACLTIKTWQEKGFPEITVSINLSHKQFHYQNMAEIVKKVLAETQVKPELLEIEISESFVIDDAVVAVKKIAAIKETGVKIALDHFGTGATSLNLLKEMPIDYLKIDKKFISGLPANQADVAVTSAAINLAHQMNIKVVALGVECREQMQYLTEHECDIVQGYLFSMPLSQGDLVTGAKLIFT